MFESLKKRVAGFIIGANKEGTEEVTQHPFSICLGSKVNIKSRNQRIYKSLCPPLNDTMQVEAIGTFTHGTSTFTRFYFENAYLQVITAAGDMEDFQECRVFFMSEYKQPSERGVWDEAKYNLGKQSVIYEEREFHRMASWADPNPERVPGVCFIENVESLEEPKKSRIEHEAMAHGRWLNEEHSVAEFLQISVMDYYDGSEMFDSGIGFDVGIDVNPKDVDVLY